MNYQAMIPLGFVLAATSPLYGQAAAHLPDARCRPATHTDASAVLRGAFQAMGGNLHVALHQR